MKYAIPATIIAVFISLIVTSWIFALNCVNQVRKEQPTDCAHHWGKWSAPEIKGDWFSGTWSYQNRTCDKCGLAEIKRLEVAPGGL